MNADIKATILAALEEHRSLLITVVGLLPDHANIVAIDKAKAALSVEAGQAGAWEPVESGFTYENDFRQLTIHNRVLQMALIPGATINSIVLPDNMRLCQRVTAPRVSEGLAVPQPDWASAPDWAMWWCVNPGGATNWSSTEPVLLAAGHAWKITEHYPDDWWYDHPFEKIDIPLGIDWRTTLQQRPDAGGE